MFLSFVIFLKVQFRKIVSFKIKLFLKVVFPKIYFSISELFKKVCLTSKNFSHFQLSVFASAHLVGVSEAYFCVFLEF